MGPISTRQSRPMTSPPGVLHEGQEPRRARAEVDDGHAGRRGPDRARRVRQHVLRVVGRRQRAHPRVEELHGLRPRGDLPVEVVGRHVGEPGEEGVPRRALLAHEALRGEELARGPALDQVRGERERRPREADERHLLAERLPGEPHRLEHVAERIGDVDSGQAPHVLRAPHGAVDTRAVTSRELEADAERLEHEQDVGEEDGRVDAQPLDGLERHLRGGVGRLAQLEEPAAGAQRPVLRHVPPRLPHQPHGRERRRPAEARLEKWRGKGHRDSSLSSATGAVKEPALSSRGRPLPRPCSGHVI